MKGLYNKLSLFINIFRFQEWVLTKYMFNLSLMAGLVLFKDIPPENLFQPALLYLCYMLPIGAFGYFLNDVTDIRYDKKIGRPNLSDRIKKPYRMVLLILFLFIGAIPALYIDENYIQYLMLLLLQILCMLIYTLPAIRFKAHAGGLFCDALFSYVFPGLIGLQLVYQTGNVNFSWPLLLVVLWLFFTGFRSVLSHQINFLQDDKASGQFTFVQKKGLKASLLIRKTMFYIELGLFAILVAIMVPEIQLGVLAGVVLCVGYEIIFLKNIDLSSFINTQNISLLNVFYNYFIFSGLCFIFIYEGVLIFVIPLLVFNTERVYALSKSFYFNVIKWFCYKFKGLIRRIKKIRR